MSEAAGRVFLFLQGPHGPFFRRLAGRMATLGVDVRRIAFNAADEVEWGGVGPLDRYRGPEASYSAWLIRYLTIHRVTDIVLYGDARPEHAQAIAMASPRQIRCHCLEEGYLRPHWITYERGGTNGNSPLNRIGLDRMAAALGPSDPPGAPPADRWGCYRAHLWHSARYHMLLLLPSRHFGRYRSRRGIGLWRELSLYARRLAGLPLRRLAHGLAARRLLTGDRDFHLALLQLSFDASMQVHSPYRRSVEFAAACIGAFARGAPAGDLLVFKAHPFEDGRERLDAAIAHEAERNGIAGRVLFLDGGGKLAALLDGALSVVTVNSTAGQQALWRGLPVAALGRAVYAKPGLTSDQDLAAFFAAPRRPEQRLYWLFRRFLIQTSQIRGSFYSRPGIRALLDALPAALLADRSPYDRVLGAAPPAPGPDDPTEAADPRERASQRQAVG
jgi:capsular polysaccharide export protein